MTEWPQHATVKFQGEDDCVCWVLSSTYTKGSAVPAGVRNMKKISEDCALVKSRCGWKGLVPLASMYYDPIKVQFVPGVHISREEAHADGKLCPSIGVLWRHSERQGYLPFEWTVDDLGVSQEKLLELVEHAEAHPVQEFSVGAGSLDLRARASASRERTDCVRQALLAACDVSDQSPLIRKLVVTHIPPIETAFVDGSASCVESLLREKVKGFCTGRLVKGHQAKAAVITTQGLALARVALEGGSSGHVVLVDGRPKSRKLIDAQQPPGQQVQPLSPPGMKALGITDVCEFIALHPRFLSDSTLRALGEQFLGEHGDGDDATASGAWTEAESSKLVDAVLSNGGSPQSKEEWDAIAAQIPSRSVKQCKHRAYTTAFKEQLKAKRAAAKTRSPRARKRVKVADAAMQTDDQGCDKIPLRVRVGDYVDDRSQVLCPGPNIICVAVRAVDPVKEILRLLSAQVDKAGWTTPRVLFLDERFKIKMNPELSVQAYIDVCGLLPHQEIYADDHLCAEG